VPADLKSILKLEVPLIVVIGSRKMAVREVLNLTPGAIVELPKPSDEELEILVNNKPVGTGVAVKVGENFGIRITYMGNLRDRIEALAGKDELAPMTADAAAAKSAGDEAIENVVNEALAGATAAAA
jgi:flagellar motor switch protein FliN/FliY